MGLFTKHYTLQESGIFNGYTDWHCHLLPGVDDGVQHMEKTLEILQHYEDLGIKEVWLTPHIMEDIPNEPDGLNKVYQQLLSKYQGPIKLNLSAENMMDILFEKRLLDEVLLPIGQHKGHLLVETSYFAPPSDLYSILQTIKSKGFFPVLAHPERYVYMEKKDYQKILDMDVVLQLNIFSLLGSYGKEAKERASKLLDKGYYTLMGTDLHSHKQLKHALQLKELTKSQIKKLKDLPQQL